MAISPRLVRALGWCALTLAGMAVVFLPFAVLERAQAALTGLAVTAVVSGFLGGIAVAGTHGVSMVAGATPALRLSLLGWFLVPLLAAPPLIVASGSWVTGLFESYSAMTTTGAVLLPPEELSRTLVMWRTAIAWIGGLANLVLAATVFAALDRRGVGLRRTSLLTVERSDLFTNFGRATQRLGLVYACITVFGTFAFLLTGTPPYEALSLAMAGVSTSGLQPVSGPLEQFLNVPGVMVLALLCLSGAWNMAVQYEALTRLRTTRGSGELRAMIAIAVALGAVAALLNGASSFAVTVFDAIFALTTSGFQTAGSVGLPSAVLILLAMLGGSTISTSGGIKMPRALLLARRAGGELSVLSHPSAAIRTRYAGRSVSDEALTGVWVYALAFPAVLGLGAVAIGFTGASFEEALMISGASITNTGPIAAEQWAGQSAFGLLTASILMILGRLEILAAAAAIYVLLVRDSALHGCSAA